MLIMLSQPTTLKKFKHHSPNSTPFTTRFNSLMNLSNFLDVQLTCNNVNVDTAVYKKPINSGIYKHWLSHAPKKLKIVNLNAILCRARNVCSNVALQKKRIKKKTTFHDINEYSLHIINRTIQEITNTLYFMPPL